MAHNNLKFNGLLLLFSFHFLFLLSFYLGGGATNSHPTYPPINTQLLNNQISIRLSCIFKQATRLELAPKRWQRPILTS